MDEILVEFFIGLFDAIVQDLLTVIEDIISLDLIFNFVGKYFYYYFIFL